MSRPPKKPDTSTLSGCVGAIIRERRIKKRLTVAEAAERAGCAAPTWYHWETGRGLSLDALPAIAAALGCKPRTLLPR